LQVVEAMGNQKAICNEMAYHAQTNGQVEWFNRILKAMIAKFVNGRQDNWDAYLPPFL